MEWRYEAVRWFDYWLKGKDTGIMDEPRLAVFMRQWHPAGPTPFKMTTQLQFGGKSDTHFILPLVPKSETKGPAFLAPTENAGLPGFETSDEGSTSGFGEISEVTRNLQTGEITVLVTNQSGQKYPSGTEHYQEKIEHRVNDNRPESASVDSTNRFQVDVSGRILVWESISNFHSDQDNFYYTCRRTLTENGAQIREKQWTKTVPRDFQ